MNPSSGEIRSFFMKIFSKTPNIFLRLCVYRSEAKNKRGFEKHL